MRHARSNRPMLSTPCSHEGCTKMSRNKYLCSTHYMAYKKQTRPEFADKQRESSRKTSRKYRAKPVNRYRVLLANSRKSNMPCDLSFEQWCEVALQPCYYCEGYFDIPDPKGCHLDRVDSLEGYVLTNVVSCCRFCNTFKSNKLSKTETKALINFLKQLREGDTP